MATGKILDDGTFESNEKDLFSNGDNLAWIYEGFELFGNPLLSIAVPKGLPDNCIQKLNGAIFAYTLGNASVDYTIKAYIAKNPPQKRHPLTDPLSEQLLQLSKLEIERSLEIESGLKGLSNRLGLFAAGAALIRLESSFSSSSLLIRLGHNFEAAAIMKLILEQLGWVLRVCEIDDGSFFKISPSKCISDLNRLISTAGSFYGVLNEEAHIKPELGKRFIRATKQGKGVVIVRDRTYSPLASFMHLCLADAFCVVLETVYRENISKPRHIRVSSGGEVTMKLNRPLAGKIRRAKAKLVEANRGIPLANHLSRIFA